MEAEDTMESTEPQSTEGGKGAEKAIPEQQIKAGSQGAP